MSFILTVFSKMCLSDKYNVDLNASPSVRDQPTVSVPFIL